MKQVFKFEFNLGTIIQIATMLTLASAGYAKFDTRLTASEGKSQELRIQVNDLTVQLQEIRIAQSRLNTILEERNRQKL